LDDDPRHLHADRSNEPLNGRRGEQHEKQSGSISVTGLSCGRIQFNVGKKQFVNKNSTRFYRLRKAYNNWEEKGSKVISRFSATLSGGA